MKAEIIGSSQGQHSLGISGFETQIQLLTEHVRRIRRSFETASTDQVLLKIENVRGTEDAHILNVTVNGTKAGHFSLFGLGKSSSKEHGGNGLSFTLDITDAIKDLSTGEMTSLDTLNVAVYPRLKSTEEQDITIQKINIYYLTKKDD